MSQAELDRTDQQVMDLVNGSASPDSKRNAKAVEERLKKTAGGVEQKDAAMEKTIAAATKRILWQSRWRQVKKLVFTVVLCTVLQLALLLVLFRPEFLIHLINIGMVITTAVAAVAFDRHRRGM